MIIFAKAHPATRTMRGGDPTPEQAASGKYPKERMPWRGLTIAIEHPEGTVREGVDEIGKPWRTVFRYAYGEILGTTGLDGDPVDVFIGSYPDAPEVYVVQQMKRKQWNKPDEQKCMINFASIDEAKAAYLGHYDDPRFFGGITAMPVDEFVAKVRATKEKPAMIKSILFFKGYVGPYLRGGKIVNARGYQGRSAHAQAGDGQMSLFGGEPQHTEPTRELIAEHERLVGVLNSPSHADDKAEAKKQAAELAEMKQEVGAATGPEFMFPSLVDEGQRKRIMAWYADGADPAKKPAERAIYLPGMSYPRLKKLLNKEKLSANDVEELKDYKYLLLAQVDDAAEKGFMVHVIADHGGFWKLKDSFLLTNIEYAMERASKPTAPDQGEKKPVVFLKKPDTTDSKKSKIDPVETQQEKQVEAVEMPSEAKLMTKDFVVKKAGRKWLEVTAPGKTFVMQLAITPSTAHYKAGDKIAGINVGEVRKESRYGVQVQYYPAPADAVAAASKAKNDAEIERWLGFVESKAGEGYVYANGVEKLRELGVSGPARERLNAAVAKANSIKAKQQAERQAQYAADRQQRDAKMAQVRSSRVLFARGQHPEIGKPVMWRGKPVVFTERGKEFRIDENQPSIHGHHLLGHEGSMGSYAYFRPATADEAAKISAAPEGAPPRLDAQSWSYSEDAVKRALAGAD